MVLSASASASYHSSIEGSIQELKLATDVSSYAVNYERVVTINVYRSHYTNKNAHCATEHAAGVNRGSLQGVHIDSPRMSLDSLADGASL
jgi:hypothetical protein